MKDGSDAIADWAILNALVNTAARRELGQLPPRRRGRHRQLAARGHGHRRRRHRRGRGAPRAGPDERPGDGGHPPRRRRLRGGHRVRRTERDTRPPPAARRGDVLAAELELAQRRGGIAHRLLWRYGTLRSGKPPSLPHVDSRPRPPAPLHLRRDVDAHRHRAGSIPSSRCRRTSCRRSTSRSSRSSGSTAASRRTRWSSASPGTSSARSRRRSTASSTSRASRSTASRSPRSSSTPARRWRWRTPQVTAISQTAAQAVPRRVHAAAHRQLQRLQRPDHPGVHPLRHALRATALRPDEQLPPRRASRPCRGCRCRCPTAASSAR